MSVRNNHFHIRLIVTRPIELEPGLVIPSRQYPGLLKETVVTPLSGRSQTQAKYWLVLSGEEIAVLKRSDRTNYASIEYDVTRHVKEGSIQVG
jgi:hypothetical protein